MAFDGKARIAAAQQALDAAKAKLSDEDREEIALRAQAEELDAQRRDEEAQQRELDLTRREEAARYATANERARGIALEYLPDSFVIVAPNGATYRAYLKKLQQLTAQKKDLVEAHIDFAKAAIYDWNGITDWNSIDDDKKAAGDRLQRFLVANPAVALLLANAAGEMSGFSEKERSKSG